MQDFWVFGYGSLIWNPGFAFDDKRLATLAGYARSFCMWSIHHRGTPEAPGLVLALDAAADAECRGVAYHVSGAEAEATLAYLRERELVSSAYLEREVRLSFDGGCDTQALAYVVDADHVQYCGGMPLEEQAQIIARAHGGRGPNEDYLYNTAQHLGELGLHDAELSWLAARVRALNGRSA